MLQDGKITKWSFAHPPVYLHACLCVEPVYIRVFLTLLLHSRVVFTITSAHLLQFGRLLKCHMILTFSPLVLEFSLEMFFTCGFVKYTEFGDFCFLYKCQPKVILLRDLCSLWSLKIKIQEPFYVRVIRKKFGGAQVSPICPLFFS